MHAQCESGLHMPVRPFLLPIGGLHHVNVLLDVLYNQMMRKA
jgi:hypothetical protein